MVAFFIFDLFFRIRFWDHLARKLGNVNVFVKTIRNVRKRRFIALLGCFASGHISQRGNRRCQAHPGPSAIVNVIYFLAKVLFLVKKLEGENPLGIVVQRGLEFHG